MELVYEPNPKHSEPWQSGRKGTLCPHGEDGPNPQALLNDSEKVQGKRYAVWKGIAFAAQCHSPKDQLPERWHGYPEAWVNIPESIRQKWLRAGKIRRSDFRRFWTEKDLEDLS